MPEKDSNWAQVSFFFRVRRRGVLMAYITKEGITEGQKYHVVIRCPGFRAFNYIHVVAKSKVEARKKAHKRVPKCEIVRVSRDYW